MFEIVNKGYDVLSYWVHWARFFQLQGPLALCGPGRCQVEWWPGLSTESQGVKALLNTVLDALLPEELDGTIHKQMDIATFRMNQPTGRYSDYWNIFSNTSQPEIYITYIF